MEVENRRKKMRRENLKPRMRLMRQQSPWRSSQKRAAGDLTAEAAASGEESSGDEDLKLLVRRLV